MSNGKLTDCGIQSGAVLWLRHSFARAFSGDSLLGDSLPVDCFASLAMTQPNVIASEQRAGAAYSGQSQQATSAAKSKNALLCLQNRKRFRKIVYNSES